MRTTAKKHAVGHRCVICNVELDPDRWLRSDNHRICPKEDWVACFERAEAERDRKEQEGK